MTCLEAWLWGLTLAAHVAAGLRPARGGRAFTRGALFAAAALLATATVSVRWAGVGHAPVFGTYENSIAAVWILSIGWVVLFWLDATLRDVCRAGAWLNAAILLWGIFFNTRRIPLTISEQSLWPEFHALFAWVAFWGLSVAFLNAGRALVRRGSAPPEKQARSDEKSLAWLLFAFAALSLSTALGSIYEFRLIGRWWSWDIIETTTLCSWLAMGLAVHMRLFHHWGGRRLAWLLALAYAFFLFAAWGIALLPNRSAFHYFELGF